MELNDTMLMVGAALIALLALNPWGWTSTKPVPFKEGATVNCRCFWCKGPKGE